MPSSETQFRKGNSGRSPKVPSPTLCALVRKLAAKGVRKADIARACEVSEPTFDKWRGVYTEIGAAFDAGRQTMHDKLVGKLFEQAMDGNFVPNLFLLKTVFGYRDSEARKDGDSPEVTAERIRTALNALEERTAPTPLALVVSADRPKK